MSRTKPNSASPGSVRAWRNGVVTAYAGSGLVFSTWVSRIPAIRDGLGLTPGTVGLILLCMSLGSFVSVAASGLVVLRLGSRLTTRVCTTIQAAGLVVMGVGASVYTNPLVVGAGLVIVGLGTASFNTASNIEGAAVERALGRHIMPRLHGSFSIGTVVGAGLGALAASVHLPVAIHVSAMAVIVWAAIWVATRHYQADRRAADAGRGQGAVHVGELDSVPGTGPVPVIKPGTTARPPTKGAASPAAGLASSEPSANDAAAALAAESRRLAQAKLDGRAKIAAAWRDPRTLLIGVLVLGLALAEGAAGDWVALALADGYGSSNAVGALGYGIFVSAMTIGRFAGTMVLDRYGRVAALRASAALAVVGLAVFVFAPNQEIALAALLFWGLGSALGFPVGMSAASDDPDHAAARVSVVSTIGYGAFLGGPPLLGLLAEHIGVLHSLLAVLVMLVVAFLLTPVVRKPAATGTREDATVEA
ncbi:MFS transporter [Arthrobacter livingstonensis]|uniref:MFS transporter n=1 Tax=Arthrobacter livingstonensis TaxID=670078 RepID=A0A2V5LA31_9MICC|nr:MFS transporter [Arthrobacter livingstonensis]PYI67314.1 MFS transporter [Arthrobacter livingstonensis]